MEEQISPVSLIDELINVSFLGKEAKFASFCLDFPPFA